MVLKEELEMRNDELEIMNEELQKKLSKSKEEIDTYFDVIKEWKEKVDEIKDRERNFMKNIIAQSFQTDFSETTDREGVRKRLDTVTPDLDMDRKRDNQFCHCRR